MFLSLGGGGFLDVIFMYPQPVQCVSEKRSPIVTAILKIY